MKKVFTIFLTIIYLSSFTGVLLGAGCGIHLMADDGTEQVNMPPVGAENDTHPLLQFCKVIEIHKEVLVPVAAKKARPALLTLPATNYTLVFKDVQGDYTSEPVQPASSAKLFLCNRALLI